MCCPGAVILWGLLACLLKQCSQCGVSIVDVITALLGCASGPGSSYQYCGATPLCIVGIHPSSPTCITICAAVLLKSVVALRIAVLNNGTLCNRCPTAVSSLPLFAVFVAFCFNFTGITYATQSTEVKPELSGQEIQVLGCCDTILLTTSS